MDKRLTAMAAQILPMDRYTPGEFAELICTADTVRKTDQGVEQKIQVHP